MSISTNTVGKTPVIEEYQKYDDIHHQRATLDKITKFCIAAFTILAIASIPVGVAPLVNWDILT